MGSKGSSLGASVYGKLDQDLASALMSINAVKAVEIGAGFAVKPTSSIRTSRKTITRSGEETEVSSKGRHDPCVGIRGVPIGEAMIAIVLADHYLRHRGQIG